MHLCVIVMSIIVRGYHIEGSLSYKGMLAGPVYMDLSMADMYVSQQVLHITKAVLRRHKVGLV